MAFRGAQPCPHKPSAASPLSSTSRLPTGLEGNPVVTPHGQVSDVDPVEDDVLDAATEVVPVGQVLLCSTHQPPDEHLQGVIAQ